MGSKNRIAKDILPIILKDREDSQWYVEPFCGGLGTLDKVGGYRIGSDNNRYLIAMWKGLQENRERPKEISKELYSKARIEFRNNINNEFDDFMIGWIGFMGSFKGRFFDGGYSGKTERRNYIDEQIRNTEKQIPLIDGIQFQYGEYDTIQIPPNSIIYCDIPYKNTKQYSTSKDFDHDKFWEWCREMSRNGHKVFISEYEAPEDFICLWSKTITNAMNTTKTYNPVERLFTYNMATS
jgi:DNA adenine methylase